jgi:hypothetical protein
LDAEGGVAEKHEFVLGGRDDLEENRAGQPHRHRAGGRACPDQVDGLFAAGRGDRLGGSAQGEGDRGPVQLGGMLGPGVE